VKFGILEGGLKVKLEMDFEKFSLDLEEDKVIGVKLQW
jgi:hypothetical protein